MFDLLLQAFLALDHLGQEKVETGERHLPVSFLAIWPTMIPQKFGGSLECLIGIGGSLLQLVEF